MCVAGKPLSPLLLVFSLASSAIASQPAFEDSTAAGVKALLDEQIADVCEASDVECALSLRQLRSAVLVPDSDMLTESDGSHKEDLADDVDEEQPVALTDTLHKKANVKTLYHLTSPEICHLILTEGFKPGSNGWCGGAIYFAATRSSVWSKAVGINSHTGCLLQAKVDVGRVQDFGPTCDLQMTRDKLLATEHDTIKFNPGDGIEYVVFDPSRVLSVKQVWKDPKLDDNSNGLSPIRVDANGKPIPAR